MILGKSISSHLFLTLIIHNQLTILPFFKYVTKNAGNGVAFEAFGVGNGSM